MDPGEQFPTPSVDSHERYHGKHMELSERAATISDDEIDLDSLIEVQRRRGSRNDTLSQMMTALQQKVQSLERQLRNEARYVDQNSHSSNVNHADRPISQDTIRGKNLAHSQRQIEVCPQLHEVSWLDFMNKFENEEKEYAIEILIGDPEYRRKLERGVIIRNKVWAEAGPDLDETSDSATSSPTDGQEATSIPDRIRINSHPILSILASIDKAIDTSAPLVMLRPFKFLVCFEDKIKDIILRLEQEVASEDSHASLDESEDLGNMRQYLPKTPDLTGSHTKLEHMQCLLQFIDHYLKPTIIRLKSDSAGKICFRDLWYIFPPGEDIFMPLTDRQRHVSLDAMTVTSEMFQSRYERMWRVIGTGGGRPDLLAMEDREKRPRQNPFKVNCYYIDYDGNYFCPIVHSFSIQPYSGFRDITSLSFFPLRFLKQGKQLRDASQAQGKMVFDALLQSHTHFYYRGPTLATHPCGCVLQSETLYQDYVESEVIIDYRTTLLKYPSWRPRTSFWKKPPNYPDEIQEKFRVRHWNDKTKSKLMRAELDIVYDDNVTDQQEALSFKEKARIFDILPSGWLSNEKSVPEDDIAMLSPRVFTFVLRTRSFAPVWLWGLQKISAQTEGLNNLQLRDNRFKDTIHALVRTHFLQTSATRGPEFEYDVVRGKGKGLVFLLHGAPGVGKTFTAESVAAANGRPLFQITCGDLGLTPSEVEKALKEIFRYAQLWNCVLLLDECDVFLTQRAKTDLKRNSLVSVFLRVLEWYTGVLFLTTNRVGHMDSAVKSRITWSTYYPPLNLAQTREIWKVNLNLVEKRNPSIELDKKSILKFAKEHFDSTIGKGLNWNGRQIQNSIKVAVSLADWETLSEAEQHDTNTDISFNPKDRKLKLTDEHFRVVVEAADLFDDYLQQATGATEEQRAYDARERADQYTQDVHSHEDNNIIATPEQQAKKRRTSSMGSTLRPPDQGNLSPSQPHFSSNTVRRPSNGQPPQHLRSSKSPAQLHNTGSTSMKSPNSLLSTAATKSQVHYASAFERVTTGKRKRNSHELFPPHQNLGTTPYGTVNHEESSGSDYTGENLVGTVFVEESDEWE